MHFVDFQIQDEFYYHESTIFQFMNCKEQEKQK